MVISFSLFLSFKFNLPTTTTTTGTPVHMNLKTNSLIYGRHVWLFMNSAAHCSDEMLNIQFVPLVVYNIKYCPGLLDFPLNTKVSL